MPPYKVKILYQGYKLISKQILNWLCPTFNLRSAKQNWMEPNLSSSVSKCWKMFLKRVFCCRFYFFSSLFFSFPPPSSFPFSFHLLSLILLFDFLSTFYVPTSVHIFPFEPTYVGLFNLCIASSTYVCLSYV